MPRLFRKSALRSAPSAPQHLSFEPANGKTSPAAEYPGGTSGRGCGLPMRPRLSDVFARTLRSLLHSWGQASRRVNKVTNMGIVLLYGCYTKDLTAIQAALC